jgi:hypothetical protein
MQIHHRIFDEGSSMPGLPAQTQMRTPLSQDAHFEIYLGQLGFAPLRLTARSAPRSSP